MTVRPGPEAGSTEERLRALAQSEDAVIRLGLPRLLALLVGRRTLAVTFGRRVWISTRLLDRPEALERIVKHELEHVRQMRREGLIPFLYEYFREYLIHRANGLDRSEAYSAIRFEEEARAAETQPGRASL